MGRTGPGHRDPDAEGAETGQGLDPSMGKALFEAHVSELRLARLLAAPPNQRPEFVVRTCRRLAGTEVNRFNLVTLGQFVLSGDNTHAAQRAARRIARDYYRADLSAKRESKSKESPTDA